MPILIRGHIHNPPLVFFHGFLGAKEDWEEVINELSPHYYCMALDLPGHGKNPFSPTEGVAIPPWFTYSQKPSLIGYSMGGRIALQLTSASPHLWKKAIICSAHIGYQTDWERAQHQKREQEWISLLEQAPFDRFLHRWYEQPLFHPLKNRPELFQKVFARRKQNNPQALIQALRFFSLSSYTPIDRYHPHTLFLHGSEDQKYADLYTQLRKQAVEGAGHAIHLENPKGCARAIKSFLEENHDDT